MMQQDLDASAAPTGLSPSVEPASGLAGSAASIPSADRGAPIEPDALTKDERSFLLYAETCCVDGGGMLVGVRMNADDHEAAKRFCDLGLMFYGRIPAELLKGGLADPTHYVELTLAGWELAWKLRRQRADRKGPYAASVWQHPLTLKRLAGAMSAKPSGDCK